MTELCVWCGVEPSIDRVELIVGKEKLLAPLCGKHYAAAFLYERLGLQAFLREFVHQRMPRGVSRTIVPRISTRKRRTR